jgi:hypothetical protein
MHARLSRVHRTEAAAALSVVLVRLFMIGKCLVADYCGSIVRFQVKSEAQLRGNSPANELKITTTRTSTGIKAIALG